MDPKTQEWLESEFEQINEKLDTLMGINEEDDFSEEDYDDVEEETPENEVEEPIKEVVETKEETELEEDSEEII